MGIISQIKVWKIIRIRKEEKAKERRERDEEGNVADEERGRRVEDGIKRERVSWEAAYGSAERGKPQHLDSGIGTDEPSTRKGSLSNVGISDVRGSDSEGIELREMDASPNSPNKGGRVVIHVIQDDEISPTLSATGHHAARSMRESREPSIHESQTGASNHFGSQASLGQEAAADGSLDPNLTLKPNITHLPFKVPDLDSRSEDGRSSVAASVASEYMADRWSWRLSGSSIVRKVSKRSQRSFIAASTSEEALMIPNTENEGASSLAATIDGVSEKEDSEEEALSVNNQKPSFEILKKQDSMEALMQGTHPSADLENDAEKSPEQSANQMALSGSQAEEAQHVNESIDIRPESVALPDSEIASITDARSTVEGANMELRASTAAKSEISDQRPQMKNLSSNLPKGASRLVTAYRTNEWAKHLDGADFPEIDELKFKKTRALDQSQPTENVAPVDVHALQQTPFDAEPAPSLTVRTHSVGDRSSSYFQSKNPFHRQRDTQQLKPAVHQLTREKAMERTPSQMSLANSMERSPSQTSLSSTRSRKEQYRPPLPKFRSSQSSIPSARGFRSSSTPMMNSPLAESPIEEGVEASFTRFTPSSTHLMSQRDSLIRSRPSSTSLLRTSWSNATLDQHPALRALNEDDDIPLSQRKSLLQRNPDSTPQTRHLSPGPTSGAATPIYSSPTGSSTPHPHTRPSGRPSLPPHDSTISAWRASLQPSTTARYHDREIEVRRASLLAEKRRESLGAREQRAARTRGQSVVDRGMRQGSMLELHQRQMRKMQAEANRSLA